ncbi:MAG: sel1 repeat family protein [bacterium]|nr:MAG: sel1 repeat family protein [bacterium]
MRVFSIFSAAIMAVLLLTSVVLPADMTDGNAAFASRDYVTALTLLTPFAEQGDVQAQLKVGFMYFYGEGIGRDYEEAAAWLTRAASQGNPIAQTMLAKMYQNGWGVERDYAKAITWCRRAAEQGYAEGQATLGQYYAEGIGCVESTAAAVDWLYKAGVSYLKNDNRDMALTMVDRIREISPDHFMLYRLLNLIYEEAGEGHKEP